MRRVQWAVAAVAAFVVVATGCSSDKSTGSGSSAGIEEGSVTISGGTADPAGVIKFGVNFGNFLAQDQLDPSYSKNQCEYLMLNYIYDTLVNVDEDNKTVPGLAQSWTVDSPTQITFKMRPNLKFSDGTPLTAAEAKAGIEYIGAGFPAKNTINDKQFFDTITAPDPATLVITTKGPMANSIPAILSGRTGMVVAPATINGTTKYVGAGPFKVANLQAGQSLQLVKNENYYAPYKFAGITFQNVELGPASVQALETGSINMVTADSKSVESITGKPNFVVVRTTPEHTLTYQNLTFRVTTPPLDKLEVRQAINMALDRNVLNQQVLGGAGQITWQAFPKGSVGYDPALDNKYPFNVTQAKEMINQAGATGATLNVVYPGQPANVEQATQAQVVKQQLEAVGFKVNLVPAVDTAAILDKFYNDKSAHIFSANIPGSIDPVQQLLGKFGPGQFIASVTGNERQDVMQGLEAYAKAPDSPEGQAGLKEASAIVTDNALEAALVFRPRNLGFDTKQIGGTIVAPNDVCDAPDLSQAIVKKQ